MKVLDNPFAITNEILQIVKDSKEFLFLVSPYTQFERRNTTELKIIKDAIINSLRREVDVVFITREPDNETTPNIGRRLKFLHEEGCKIFSVPKLHAKIYCNESKALITSMNLILVSILNNKEIGITLNKEIEPDEFNQIIVYVKEFTKDNKRRENIDVALGKEIVYVLKLENSKWYVGKTKDLKNRLKAHKSGSRSPWTQMNKIINVEEIFEDGDLKTITLDYMKRYGWENVRGYAWSQWNMKQPPKELRE
jgi:HKD family nuclease